MSQWYYAKNGQQLGPVSAEAIKAGVVKGQLTSSDLVWQDGMSDWRKIKDIPELASNGTAQPQRPAQAAQPRVQQAAQPAVAQPQYQAPAAQPQYQQPLQYSQPHQGGAVILTDRAIEMLRQTGPWVRFFGVLLWIGVGLGTIGVVLLLMGAVFNMGTGRSGGFEAGVMMLIMALVWAAMLLLYFIPGLYLNRYASRISELMRTRREDVAEAALQAQKSFWKFMGIVVLISIALYLLMIAIIVLGGLAAVGSSSRGGPW